MPGTVFLASNQILRPALEAWLGEKWGPHRRSTGIQTFSRADDIFISIDTFTVGLREIAQALAAALPRRERIVIVAPSMVQYFADVETLDGTPIQNKLAELAKYPVWVENAPIFRITAQKAKAEEAFVSFSWFPSSRDAVDLKYIDADGRKLAGNALDSIGELVHIPLTLYHWALERQKLDQDALYTPASGMPALYLVSLLLLPHSNFNAFWEKFGSKLKSLGYDRTVSEQLSILGAKHQYVISNSLSIRGWAWPERTTNPQETAFNDFSHVILSGLHSILPKLELKLPPVYHVGMPTLARDGVFHLFDGKRLVTRLSDDKDSTDYPKLIVAEFMPRIEKLTANLKTANSLIPAKA